MPKPKRDKTVSDRAYEQGWLVHPRKLSYVGLDGHVYLEGPDKMRQREMVFAFHGYRCCVCGAALLEEGGEFTRGHWHHPSRCDCITCTEIRCNPFSGRPCHQHGKSGFQRRAGNNILD